MLTPNRRGDSRRDTIVVLASTKRATFTEAVTWNHALLNMTIPSKTRDLANRLLEFEAGANKSSEPGKSATLRVYEKLRDGLSEFAGTAGFESIASRALALARTEAPSLNEVRVSSDGKLQGLGQGPGELEHQIDIDKDRAGESLAGEGEILLIARILGLLLLFLGEAIVLGLLRVTWPGAAFDDRNSDNGRKE
jgi:hypothetical protein